MISKEEIKKMADLARIDITDEEVENLRGEVGDILDYVSQVSDMTTSDVDAEKSFNSAELHNVMREDENPTETGTHSKEIITEFPNKERDYLKVKKIL